MLRTHVVVLVKPLMVHQVPDGEGAHAIAQYLASLQQQLA